METRRLPYVRRRLELQVVLDELSHLFAADRLPAIPRDLLPPARIGYGAVVNRPLTLQGFLIVLVTSLFVAMVPLGYAWTALTSHLDDVDYRIKRIHTKLDQIGACQLVRGHALANKDRIDSADARLTEMESLLRECATKLTNVSSPN